MTHHRLYPRWFSYFLYGLATWNGLTIALHVWSTGTMAPPHWILLAFGIVFVVYGHWRLEWQ